MPVIIIKRSDANAVRANDLLSALNAADQFAARIELVDNRIQGMDDAQAAEIYGVDENVGGALKTLISDLETYLNDAQEAFAKFRSQLG